MHATLRLTPAMEAGIADHVWSREEIVSLLEKDAMNETHFLAFGGAFVASFVWTQWQRKSSRTTRAAGVVFLLGAFIVFSWLTP